jgi:hypothetical protein
MRNSNADLTEDLDGDDLDVVNSELTAELRDISANLERFETGPEASVDFEYGDVEPYSQVMASLVRVSETKGFFNFTVDTPGRGEGCIHAWLDFETGELRTTQVDHQSVPPRQVAQVVLNFVREFKARK